MTLDYYKSKFAKLRVDSKPYWPDATFNQAPYKPILLLSIMDLIAQQVIGANMIGINADLVDAFELYWIRIIGASRESNPVMPFNHMRSEGFWHLVDAHGTESDLRNMDRNEIFRRIKNQALFARLDKELFTLMQISDSRDSLRRILIEQYFSPEVRSTIAEVSYITTESFEYSRNLLNRSRGRFNLKESPSIDEIYITDVRSTAFRRVIVGAYQHTCAVCRIRIVTPEGRTSVAAAHIVPWSHSHNDDPRNGIALCGLHHWVFDQGLIVITSEYTIKISPVLALEEQYTEPLLMLDGTEIFKPFDRILWPARVALRWHIDNIFRSANPYTLL